MSDEAMRQAAADAVNDVFVADDRVAIVLAEISTPQFRRAAAHDPRRYVNVGIMEQAMVGVAAGFALEGFRPVVHTIASFLAERAFEQVKLDFGYQRLEGLLLSNGASYDYGEAGMTHHSPGDVATLANVPGMEIVLPGHALEADALVRSTYANGRLTYLRTTVAENSAARRLPAAGLEVVRRGRDLTVIAVGPMLDRTLAALDGTDATVLYATTVLPLDLATLAAEAGRDVVTVEPFYEGTLTAQVAAALVHRPARILSIGVAREIISRYGTPEQHDHALGLDAAGIRARLHAFVDAGRALRAA